MEESLIYFEGVSRRYGEVQAVDNMSFAVQQGELLGCLGPNGSGKTTTIRLMNGVISPDSGKITVAGMDAIAEGAEIRARSGVLTESANLYESMTVEENLRFFARLYRVEEKAMGERINALLEQFHLSEKRRSRVGGLSTGLKKRTAIAKALIHKPELLFLDEPTSGLDPEAAREIIEQVKLLNQSGVTVFVCTHNLAEAEQFCTRFVFLDRGRILEQGTLQELEQKYVAEIQLFVETGRGKPEGLHLGVPWEQNADGFTVKLPGKASIPLFLREVSAQIDMYGAKIENSNLEALYFEIRRARQ
jgi:ABC-2 type transport system ATP-binding protein